MTFTKQCKMNTLKLKIMANTQGDSSYGYFSPESGVSPKSVRVMKEAICAPDEEASTKEKEDFVKILKNYSDF